jgi:hypothetical protein
MVLDISKKDRNGKGNKFQIRGEAKTTKKIHLKMDGPNLLDVEENPHSQIILLSKTLQSTYLQHQLETMK